MYYHVKDIAGEPYKIKKKRKTKRQNRRQSVVAGRQQLYCAVQSRSPSHCQMTTGKVQSSARDGTSSATVHSWQTTAGCSTHVPKPLGRHGHWEGTEVTNNKRLRSKYGAAKANYREARSIARRLCDSRATCTFHPQLEHSSSVRKLRIKTW